MILLIGIEDLEGVVVLVADDAGDGASPAGGDADGVVVFRDVGRGCEQGGAEVGERAEGADAGKVLSQAAAASGDAMALLAAGLAPVELAAPIGAAGGAEGGTGGGKRADVGDQLVDVARLELGEGRHAVRGAAGDDAGQLGVGGTVGEAAGGEVGAAAAVSFQTVALGAVEAEAGGSGGEVHLRGEGGGEEDGEKPDPNGHSGGRV